MHMQDLQYSSVDMTAHTFCCVSATARLIQVEWSCDCKLPEWHKHACLGIKKNSWTVQLEDNHTSLGEHLFGMQYE